MSKPSTHSSTLARDETHKRTPTNDSDKWDKAKSLIEKRYISIATKEIGFVKSVTEYQEKREISLKKVVHLLFFKTLFNITENRT